jgi:hypothetical protein
MWTSDNVYSDQENAILLKGLAEGKTMREICADLPQRTFSSIRGRCTKLKLKEQDKKIDAYFNRPIDSQPQPKRVKWTAIWFENVTKEEARQASFGAPKSKTFTKGPSHPGSQYGCSTGELSA